MSFKMYTSVIVVIVAVLFSMAHIFGLIDVMTYIQETSFSRSHVRDLPAGKPLNIVLLGKTGHGKSATANSIFGNKDLFTSEMSPCSVTIKCQKESGVIGGRNISLVDTPGTMDTKHKDEALEEIGNAITLLADGIDAFVIVLRIDVRNTEEEQMSISLLKKVFGHDALLKYGVLVFTHGDNFIKSSKQSFDEFVISQKGDMENLFKEFSYRCALIDNTQKDPAVLRDQVIHIFTLIEKLVRINGEARYTNDLFDLAKKALELEKYKQDAALDRKRQEEIEKIVASRVADELRRRETDCFPSDALVTLYGGKTITVADLRVGHKVLSKAEPGTLVYSEVYFFAHLNPNVSNEYINLRSLGHNVKLTPQHHIYIVRNGQMKTIAAREVKIGDSMLVLDTEISSLVHEPVMQISLSTEVGIYAPITMSGTIIVNNVLASCYVDLVPPIYSHPMLWPLRQLYRLSPSLTAMINADGKDGMPVWVQFIVENLLV